MPGHGNFTSVTLGAEGGADVLKVNGESEGDIDLVEAILVVLSPTDVGRTQSSTTAREELHSASVALPAGQSRWTATFSGDQAPFDGGETLLLIGVMTSEDTGDAFVWQQALTIAPDTAPANVH
jgi:hypothetical protein